MRLIDADKLRYEAELCRETTDAFQELIDRQPDYYDPVPLLVSCGITEYRERPFGCPKCGAQWISYDQFGNGVANYCPVCGHAVIAVLTGSAPDLKGGEI